MEGESKIKTNHRRHLWTAPSRDDLLAHSTISRISDFRMQLTRSKIVTQNSKQFLLNRNVVAHQIVQIIGRLDMMIFRTIDMIQEDREVEVIVLGHPRPH